MVKRSGNWQNKRTEKKVEFLTLDQILVIHEDQIERYGGSGRLRDLALLESAVFRPQTTFGGFDLYPALFEKAAALMHSLILNHPFIDGNKRTAMASAFVFLELNGISVKLNNQDVVKTALQIESRKLDIETISKLLIEHSKKQKD